MATSISSKEAFLRLGMFQQDEVHGCASPINSKNCLGVKIEIPRKGCNSNKSLSPVII
ncbi:MAG: hypothetical protein WAN66_06245 [Limnoraphis robusta]